MAALSLVQPTKKRQHAHRVHVNKLVYILLRRALSANTKNSRVVVMTGSSPSEHVAMLAHWACRHVAMGSRPKNCIARGHGATISQLSRLTCAATGAGTQHSLLMHYGEQTQELHG